VTTLGAAGSILARGLCCTTSLVRDSTLSADEQQALLACLDDRWSLSDWIAHLNRHVFFWPGEERLRTLLLARMNRERAREVLVFDTLSLVTTHADRTCLSPINSGATVRNAPRRGAATFAPIGACSWAQWRRLRGMRAPDDIAEVVVRGDVPDASRHLIEVRRYRGLQRLA
jgi:hypothetical protein